MFKVIKFPKGKNLSIDEIPSMEEMFRKGYKIKQKKKYSTKEIIKLSHELREEYLL